MRARTSETGGPPLDQAVVDEIASRLRTLGDAKRIALLEALAVDGEASVQELADRICVSHQNASHHLSLLRRAGMVNRRQDGPTSIYAIEDWTGWWVISQLAGLVAEDGVGNRD